MRTEIAALYQLLSEAKFKPGDAVQFDANPVSILLYGTSPTPPKGTVGTVVKPPAALPAHVKKNFVFVDFGTLGVLQIPPRDLAVAKKT